MLCNVAENTASKSVRYELPVCAPARTCVYACFSMCCIKCYGFSEIYTHTNIGSTLIEHTCTIRYVHYFILISKQRC